MYAEKKEKKKIKIFLKKKKKKLKKELKKFSEFKIINFFLNFILFTSFIKIFYTIIFLLQSFY